MQHTWLYVMVHLFQTHLSLHNTWAHVCQTTTYRDNLIKKCVFILAWQHYVLWPSSNFRALFSSSSQLISLCLLCQKSHSVICPWSAPSSEPAGADVFPGVSTVDQTWILPAQCVIMQLQQEQNNVL